jgi:hypothetical protein
MVETRANKRAKELLEKNFVHCHPVLIVEKAVFIEKWSFKQTYSRRAKHVGGSFAHLVVS